MLQSLADAMAKNLRDTYGVDAVEVVGYEEEMMSDGYCETCWYEYVGLKITYRDSSGQTEVMKIAESFAEYIRDLTD